MYASSIAHIQWKHTLSCLTEIWPWQIGQANDFAITISSPKLVQDQQRWAGWKSATSQVAFYESLAARSFPDCWSLPTEKIFSLLLLPVLNLRDTQTGRHACLDVSTNWWPLGVWLILAFYTLGNKTENFVRIATPATYQSGNEISKMQRDYQ